jgi:hypothetical protein
MDDREKPNLSLGDLTDITDELYQMDGALWECLEPLLRRKGGLPANFVLAGPRPAKLTAKFYLVLSNYSREAFNSEANRYPRYPVNPHSSKWLQNLAQRVEDHALEVVRDIEKNPDKDFAYHEVTEDGIRAVIREALLRLMQQNYQFKGTLRRMLLPSTPPSARNYPAHLPSMHQGNTRDPRPPGVVNQMREGDSRLLESSKLVVPTPSFREELKRLLNEARIRPEDIAEEIGIEPRNVYRHLAGETAPSLTNLKKYETALSKHLKTPVKLPHVSKTSRRQ